MRSTSSPSGAAPGERVGDVRGGVGRRQRDRVAAVDQRDGDGGRQGCLADAALAHRHHHAVAGARQFVDQFARPGRSTAVASACPAAHGRVPVSSRRASSPVTSPAISVDGRAGSDISRAGALASAARLASVNASAAWSSPGSRNRPLSTSSLIGDAERGQFVAGARRLASALSSARATRTRS